MSAALLALLFGGSALGLTGTLFVLFRARSGPRQKPARVARSLAPEPPLLPLEGPRLLFAPHSSQLGSGDRRALGTWAASLAGHPGYRIVVVGSADALGNPSQNRRLARERAQAAARVLTEAGLAGQRLEVQWQEPQPGRTEQEQVALRSVRVRAVPAP